MADMTKILTSLVTRSFLSSSTKELKHPNICSPRPNRSNTPTKNFQPWSATFTAGVANTCIVCKGEKHPCSPVSSSRPCLETICLLSATMSCASTAWNQVISSNNALANRQKVWEDSLHSPKCGAIPQLDLTFLSNVSNTLLMTCQVQVNDPAGTSIKARALLDSGSTMSVVLGSGRPWPLHFLADRGRTYQLLHAIEHAHTSLH